MISFIYFNIHVNLQTEIDEISQLHNTKVKTYKVACPLYVKPVIINGALFVKLEGTEVSISLFYLLKQFWNKF